MDVRASAIVGEPPYSAIHAPGLAELVDDDPYDGLEQVLWSDAVLVRRYTDLRRLEPVALWKLAWFAHELYGSHDLAALALSRSDERDAGERQRRHVDGLQVTL